MGSNKRQPTLPPLAFAIGYILAHVLGDLLKGVAPDRFLVIALILLMAILAMVLRNRG